MISLIPDFKGKNLKLAKYSREKTKFMGDGYKLFCMCKINRNGVGIVIKQDLLQTIVRVNRKSYKLMTVKLVFGMRLPVL